ncbi:MAG: TRAP transporter large permease subunit [Desulfurococcaceae archaeon]
MKISLAIFIKKIIFLVYAFMILAYFVTGWGGSLKFAVVMLPFSAIIWVIDSLYKGGSIIPRIKNKIINRCIGIVIILLSVVAGLYLDREFWELVTKRSGSPAHVDLLFGGVLIFIILLHGAIKYPVIFAIVIFFMLNALFGKYFPGILQNPGIGYNRLLSALSVDFYTGIFESLTQIGLTYVSAFMLFAGVIKEMGLVNSIINIALTKIRKSQYIPLLNAIVGVPVGMVVGSAAAGTAAVGSLTIPLVNRIGIPLTQAAALAAAVGIGALLMPPIMSAIAFLMADALGVSYFEVVVRGFVPALVYFAGVGTSIYYITRRHVATPNTNKVEGIGTLNNDVFSHASILDYINIAIFLFGLTHLIVTMASWVYPPIAAIRAAFVVLLITLVTHFVYSTMRERRGIREVVSHVVGRLSNVLEYFVLQTVEIVLLLSLLANIKALFTITGLSHKVGTSLVRLGGENFYLILILSYLYAYIVGAGVPPLGTYVIIYTTVVPAIIRVGLDPWVAQFVAFFMSVHAEFAPPVSVAAATASKISKAPYLSVLKELVKMGIALLVLIFITPLRPELVTSPGLQQLQTGLEIVLGIVGLETALYGILYPRRLLDIFLRLLLAASSVLSFLAGGVLRLLCLGFTLLLTAYAFYASTRFSRIR